MNNPFILGFSLLLSPILFGQNENEVTKIVEQRQLLKYEISVSPNPCQGNFELRARPGSVVQISAASGTHIGTWMMEDGVLNIEGMPTGSYFIFITTDDCIETKKIVVL